MSRRLKVLIAVVVAIAAAQLIRPDRTNPPTEASRTLAAQAGPSSALAGILARACADCHSNNTLWPGYTEIAPLSWLMAYAVNEGRKVVNFSEWAAYPAERQRTLLAESCSDAGTGKMPGVYTLLHPEMKLSTQDVETICAAARQATAVSGGGH